MDAAHFMQRSQLGCLGQRRSTATRQQETALQGTDEPKAGGQVHRVGVPLPTGGLEHASVLVRRVMMKWVSRPGLGCIQITKGAEWLQRSATGYTGSHTTWTETKSASFLRSVSLSPSTDKSENCAHYEGQML